MFMNKKVGKRSFAILGMAAMSMAALTPVYAAEIPENKNTTTDANFAKETTAVVTGTAVPVNAVTSDTSKVKVDIWSDLYKDVDLEIGKLYTRDSSGKLVKLTDSQARAVNPLHDINLQRQSLIMDSVASGEWFTYYAFEATQAPYHYDLNADGKLVPNKNYFGNLVATSHRAMVEARMAGDKETEQIWANDLKQTIEKYNAAPGMSVYIPQVNSNASDIEFYGIEAPDAKFFDSVYNNNDVRTKGYAGSQYWYENEYFLDNPEIFVEIVKSISNYNKMPLDTLYSITSNYDKAVEERAKAKAEAEKAKIETEKAEIEKSNVDSVKDLTTDSNVKIDYNVKTDSTNIDKVAVETQAEIASLITE